MRRTSVLTAFLVLALAGCGGSSSPAATTKSSPSPSPAETPLTKAQATAAANAINLTAADVGAGYTSTPASKDETTQKEDAQFAACLGSTLPAAAVVDLSSPDFSQGTGLQMRQVSSDVTVLPKGTQARTDLAAYSSPKAIPCFKRFIAQALAAEAGGAVTFAPPVVKRVPTGVVGTDGEFGYDVTMTAQATGISINVDVVFLAFLVKRCEVSLQVLSIGQPFPAAERATLLTTLVTRAKASAV